MNCTKCGGDKFSIRCLKCDPDLNAEKEGYAIDQETIASIVVNKGHLLTDKEIKALDELLNNEAEKGEKCPVTPQQLHQWYLEAVMNLNKEDFNAKAVVAYKDLTDGQKFIDKYIADKINSLTQ